MPDLPGVFSSGETFDDAMKSMKEAIDLHLEGLVEDGDDIQAARPIAEHQANPDFANGVWAVVDIDVSRFDRTEKINITVPPRVLVQIGNLAKARANCVS